MKILYGVCGEGRGHASRSRILIQHLQQNGHMVSIVAGGKAYQILSEEFDHVLKIATRNLCSGIIQETNNRFYSTSNKRSRRLLRRGNDSIYPLVGKWNRSTYSFKDLSMYL